MKTIKMLLLLSAAVLSFGVKGYAQDLKAEYDKLKKEYTQVAADRDNILLQSKSMMESSQRAKEVEAQYKTLQEEHAKLAKELQMSKDEAALLNKTVSEQKDAVAEKTKDLEDKASQLVEENNKLKNSLEKAEIEYKIVPETKREIARLQADKKDLLKKNAQLDVRSKSLEAERLDRDAQVEIYRKQVVEFKKRYEQAMAKNRQLEKRVEQLPVKFAEMARENKVLLKETALMHYNLGVFYTKNKEYARAIAEFEKSTELNPDDPYAHFNLGYIYAEYLVDRPKAIVNFRKYLGLLKTDDKDVDWVKKYILTWQTWEGKKPVQ
jgi:tetratricopeptide (TPR) repeat protein